MTLPPEIDELLRDVAAGLSTPDIRGRAGAALVSRGSRGKIFCPRCGGSGYERIGDGSANAWGVCEVCRAPSPRSSGTPKERTGWLAERLARSVLAGNGNGDAARDLADVLLYGPRIDLSAPVSGTTACGACGHADHGTHRCGIQIITPGRESETLPACDCLGVSGTTESAARIAWQCSGCGCGFAGPWQKTCPVCGLDDFWTGSVHPSAKLWSSPLGAETRLARAFRPGLDRCADPLAFVGASPTAPTACTCRWRRNPAAPAWRHDPTCPAYRPPPRLEDLTPEQRELVEWARPLLATADVPVPLDAPTRAEGTPPVNGRDTSWADAYEADASWGPTRSYPRAPSPDGTIAPATPTTEPARDPDARVKKGFRLGVEAAARAVEGRVARPGLGTMEAIADRDATAEAIRALVSPGDATTKGDDRG